MRGGGERGMWVRCGLRQGDGASRLRHLALVPCCLTGVPNQNETFSARSLQAALLFRASAVNCYISHKIFNNADGSVYRCA